MKSKGKPLELNISKKNVRRKFVVKRIDSVHDNRNSIEKFGRSMNPNIFTKIKDSDTFNNEYNVKMDNKEIDLTEEKESRCSRTISMITSNTDGNRTFK